MMKAIKKITRNLSHIFLLSSIFSFYFILNNHFPVYADSVHLIGSFYLTQMVNSITKVYVFQDSLQWAIDCGNHQSTLSSILNSMYAGGGIRINEYFSSFVGHNEYNSSEYGFCSSTYLDNHFNIIDPLTGNDCIDLVHLFASLDGIFENTGETTQNLTIFDYLTKDTFRYLVSWGGDLQSVAHQVQDSGMSDFDFYDVLLQNNNFSFYDFYADVDATNIATRLSLNNCGEISQLISSYYQGLINENFDRNTLFVEKIASTANPNYSYLSNESAFLSITADILKMDGNLNDCFPVVYDTIKYHLLKKNTFPYNYPNHQTRFNLEIAFLEYFGIILYE